MNDHVFMQEALDLALKAKAEGEVPIGAIVVDAAQQIVSKAYNQTIHLVDPSAHAEILALRQAALAQDNYRLPGCTLYVTLEPCVMCAGAIIQARLKRVVFGAFDQRSGALSSVFQLLQHPQLNHHAEVLGGVLEAKSVALLQEFFKERRGKAGV